MSSPYAPDADTRSVVLSRLFRHKKGSDTPYALGGMVGILAFLIVGVFGLAVANRHLLGSESLAAVISAVLVDLTNGDRGGNSLGGLTVSPVLSKAAQAKADDMAAKSYFAHVSPDGTNSWYWFRQQGYTFLYAGENLAVDFSDSINVERAWMNSPTHRANILNGHFTEIGIATAQGTYNGRSTTFVAQMFGTPRTTSDVVRGKPAEIPITQTVSPSEPMAPALATTQAPVRVATNAAPVVAANVLGTEADSILPASASWWQHLFASPSTMLRYAYYALGLMTLAILAYVTELEFHRRHLRHVFAALLLATFMAVLFIIANMAFFSPPVIVAIGDATVAEPLQN